MLYSLPANTAFVRYFSVALSIQTQAKYLLLTRCQQLTDHSFNATACSSVIVIFPMRVISTSP